MYAAQTYSSEMLTTQTNISLKIRQDCLCCLQLFTFPATPRQSISPFFLFSIFLFNKLWFPVCTWVSHWVCTRSSTDFILLSVELWGLQHLWATAERPWPCASVWVIGWAVCGWPPSMLPPPLSFTYHQHSHWGDEVLSACGLCHLVHGVNSG